MMDTEAADSETCLKAWQRGGSPESGLEVKGIRIWKDRER